MRKKMFYRSRKEKKEAPELDITSLLDILVILLIFLIKGYNTTDLKLDLVDNLKLPGSTSESLVNNPITIQINSKKDIWSKHKKIGSINTTSGKIEPLFDFLQEEAKKKDKEINQLEQSRSLANIQKDLLSSKKATRKMINIVMDQGLPYQVLKRVMHTSAIAGFPEFKFIVEGKL